MTLAVTVDPTADFPDDILQWANGDTANTATGTTIFTPIANALGYLVGNASRYIEGPDSDTTINPDTYSRVKVGPLGAPRTYIVDNPTLTGSRYLRIYTRNVLTQTLDIERADATSLAQFQGAAVAWLDLEWYNEGGGDRWFVTGWGGDVTIVQDP